MTFVIYDRAKQRIPIKVWLKREGEIEEECLRQAMNLSNLPFAFSHVALMPDTHSGYGMPIGGVLAADGAIIPNAVGVDIGCGVCFLRTNLPADLLRRVKTGNGTLGEKMVGSIMRCVPLGFAHHKVRQKCSAIDEFDGDWIPAELRPELQAGYYQVGTLGGGNHFIELQEDEEGNTAVMLHSGSRNFGYKICRYFNKVAKEINERVNPRVPKEWDLAYLPVESKEGKAYLSWMALALKFAAENRRLMMERVKEVLFDCVAKETLDREYNLKFDLEVNAHHNYAAFEEHFGQKVWVHRKGAIRAGRGEPGIIPGAMGGFSYIVKGLGNPDSFYSCSHGAGRRLGRKEALRRFSAQEVIDDLKRRHVILGKEKKADIAEEYLKAYKDIEEVLENEKDLAEPVLKLRTVCVIKG